MAAGRVTVAVNPVPENTGPESAPFAIRPTRNSYCEAPTPLVQVNFVVDEPSDRVEPGNGLIMRAGAEPLTTKTAPVDLEFPALDAVMVKGYEPNAVVGDVTIFNPVAPAPISVAGLKYAVAPAGSPVATNVT